MQLTPIQALEIILDGAHQASFPKVRHDEFDTLARFVANALAKEQPAPPPAAPEPPPSPAVEKAVAKFTPKDGAKPVRTKRGKVEAVA